MIVKCLRDSEFIKQKENNNTEKSERGFSEHQYTMKMWKHVTSYTKCGFNQHTVSLLIENYTKQMLARNNEPFIVCN